MAQLISKQFQSKKWFGGGGGGENFFPNNQFRSCNEEEYRGKVFRSVRKLRKLVLEILIFSCVKRWEIIKKLKKCSIGKIVKE
jgi:hypothetical protein